MASVGKSFSIVSQQELLQRLSAADFIALLTET